MISLTHHPTRLRTNYPEALSSSLISGGRHGAKIYDRRLLLVLMLIENNLRRQLAIRNLAEAVSLSPGRLAHLFKSEVGVSPQRYLNNIRLEKSKQCLENSLRSIKEIAAEVGFPNVSSFCRSFKARFGLTPREYRRAHLKIDLKILDGSARAAQILSA